MHVGLPTAHVGSPMTKQITESWARSKLAAYQPTPIQLLSKISGDV